MSDRRYLKPPWMQRKVGNRLEPLFRPSLVWKLSVPGRRSGNWHTTIPIDRGMLAGMAPFSRSGR